MSQEITRVVQVGCGYWGPNVLRNLANNPRVQIVGVIDQDRGRGNWVAEHYPGVPFETDFTTALLDRWEADSVVLATPANSHYALARQVLDSGRHCLVEKPLAQTEGECRVLIDLAKKTDRVLMVGHTFLYNSVVRELKSIISRGELGEVYYAHAQRLNLGKIRQDVDAAWNLAPHDISILIYLFGATPLRVAARGASFIHKNIADVAFIDLEFPGGQYASIHVSWLDPQKTRRITLVGSKQMAVYDDIAENKLTIFDKGVDRTQPEAATLGSFEDFATFQLLLRAGGITIPEINFIEPLKTEVEEFISAIMETRPALTDGLNGLHTVQVLEAVTRSMANGGSFVSVGEKS